MRLYYGNYSDYELQQKLGSGASGTAYLAKKISTNTTVVVKKFDNDTKIKSIKREIKLLKSVHDHPNIAELIDVF